MATAAQDISGDAGRVSFSQGYSTSPTASFQSPPPGSLGTRLNKRPTKNLTPFNTQSIKILLLENVNQTGRDILTAQGYQVEALRTSLPEDELIEKIRYVDPRGYLYTATRSKLNPVKNDDTGTSTLSVSVRRRSSTRRSSRRRRTCSLLDASVSARTRWIWTMPRSRE